MRDSARRIPDTGHDLPRLAGIVRYQLKNFDGSGYPTDAQRGEGIPLGARLLRILDDIVSAQQSGAAPGQIV